MERDNLNYSRFLEEAKALEIELAEIDAEIGGLEEKMANIEGKRSRSKGDILKHSMLDVQLVDILSQLEDLRIRRGDLINIIVAKKNSYGVVDEGLKDFDSKYKN
ncbi:MAG: hypothetical protein HY918_03120 [Candidatus Doudnabacteria bacterium]|nr:hypothetical protein [Candidatus Doudnabacteria bacterium]